MNKVVIYGAGRTGKTVLEKCFELGIEIEAFVDNKISGNIDDIPVVSPAAVPETIDRRLPVILALHHDVHAAAAAMKHAGFSELITLAAFNIFLRENNHAGIEIGPLTDSAICDSAEVEQTRAILADDRSRQILQHYLDYLKYGRLDDLERGEPGIMYFPDNRPFEFHGKVTMADCGAYIGDTIMSLADRIDFSEIYAFEPDTLVAEQLEKNLSKYSDIKLHLLKSGVGAKCEVLSFAIDGSGRGTISENGTLKIDVVSLDSVFKEDTVDFIKMDIEGAEADALIGAAEVIKRDMPLLEISVYHLPGDFWKLPLLIKKLNPEYSVYLRCGDDSFHDTVCCAVPERFKLK